MPLLRLLALFKFTTAGWLRDEEPAARTPVQFRLGRKSYSRHDSESMPGIQIYHLGRDSGAAV